MIFFFCAIPSAMMMLFYAFHALHQEIAELQAVTAAYRLRVGILDSIIDQKPIAAHCYFQDTIASFTDPLYECEAASSFTLLNRNLDYLKESTHRFFKAQQLDVLLNHIDHTVWEMYSGFDGTPKAPGGVRKKNKRSVSTNKKIVHMHNEKAVLQWPIQIDKFWLSSLYGPRRKRDGSVGFHYGIDMAAIKGTPVMAAAGGTVVQAHYAGGLGNAVMIRHSNHLTTRYAHLHAVLVRPGQKVFAGMIIGKVGETGYIRKKTNDGSHLHFELYTYNTRINPLLLLPSLS